MKNIIIAVVVIILVGGGYYWYTQQEAAMPTETQTEEVMDSSAQQKINIDVVCEAALTYMTFPDGESADAFVAECKAGEHPEVIERYKAEMNIGDDAAI